MNGITTHEFGAVRILEGDVCESLKSIAPGSVNCVVTSPPYWRLRSYLADDHERKPLELGSENTPDEFIANLVGVFELVKVALADHGVVFVNLADTYCNDDKWGGGGLNTGKQTVAEDGSVPSWIRKKSRKSGLKARDRAGIPERFALAMQAAGWYWRDTILWHKPAPMPMSFNGWRFERCRVKVDKSKREHKGHERLQGGRSANGKDFDSSAKFEACPGCPKCTPNDGYVLRKGSFRTTPNYEPIFMFAKTASYFCDREAVAEPASTESVKRYDRGRSDSHKFADGGPGDNTIGKTLDHMIGNETRNPRSIWTIGPDNYKGEHYAAFPRELPEKCLRMAMSHKGYCVSCGMPWARVVEHSVVPGPKAAKTCVHDKRSIDGAASNDCGSKLSRDGVMPGYRSKNTTLGWRPTCQCETNTPQPGLVCDPFTGTGTVAEVAIKMGHGFVGGELNPAYIDQIRERIVGKMPLFAS